jgi:hypothetical protein
VKLSAKTNNDQGSGETAKSQQSIDTEKAAENQSEVAEGQGQFDYLQRLADHIHRLDDEIRYQGPGKIAAVGILGSDVYDKQLLIEALKPELPEAVFFTTDLDALLLPHDKYRSTRNLIVASSYGLELAPDLQCEIPPFRTSYQSSIFLATRLAIQNISSDAADPDLSEKATGALSPRLPNKSQRSAGHMRTTAKLFQIGRSQVQALPTAQQSLPDNNKAGIEPCNRKNAIDNFSLVDPTEAYLFPEIKSASVVASGLLIAIVMLAVALTSSKGLRGLCVARGNTTGASHTDSIRPNFGWIVTLITGAVLVGIGLSASWPWWASLLTEYGLGEPMSLFEGISVWPTVALRAISIFLGVWFVFYTLERLKTDLKLRRDEMGLKKPPLRFWIGHSLVDRWYKMAALLFWRPIEKVGPPGNHAEQKREFDKWWHTYYYYGRKHWRLVRAVIGALAMMALWLLLRNIFGTPDPPARGPVAHSFYKWVTIIDVIITFLVIFLVVDATLLSRSVVVRLTAIESHWPLAEGDRDQEDWFDIKFIARRTSCITQLIYFPFVMLALLIVSRSPIFDNYTFTPTSALLQVISLAIIVVSVSSLRRAAEKARKNALDHLSEKIAANHDNPSAISQLESLRTQVRDMQEGAFASPLSQPIVKAVLLPLVSYGGTWLAQLYALPGM